MADDEGKKSDQDASEKDEGPQGMTFIDGPGPAVEIGFLIREGHGAAVHGSNGRSYRRARFGASVCIGTLARRNQTMSPDLRVGGQVGFRKFRSGLSFGKASKSKEDPAND